MNQGKIFDKESINPLFNYSKKQAFKERKYNQLNLHAL
jgi:hypothetical protein